MSGIETMFDYADKRIKDFSPHRKHLKVFIGSLALLVFVALIIAMLIFMAFMWSELEDVKTNVKNVSASMRKPTGQFKLTFN